MLLARKKNMTQVFDETNNVVPVTILDFSECYIVKGEKKSGNYLSIGSRKNAGKQKQGIFKDKTPEYCMLIDDEIKELEELNEGDVVNLTGKSKGKGFAGVIKMWGFHGLKATHGQKHKARHVGSIGQRTTPGRVWVGKKMPRRMGNEMRTVRGLKVISVDKENKLICVKGSVPGTYNSILEIQKA